MSTDNKLLIIIPCYNEEYSIENLIFEIKNIKIKCDILVIDDGSKDKTFDKARKLTNTIRLNRNLGIGGAVQTGLKYAMYNNYNLCIQIDGDGQHDPSEIKKLLISQKTSKSSLTIGSRYLSDHSFKSTFARRSGTYIIAQLLNFLYRSSHITDPTSGMRLMDKKAITSFAREYPSDYPEPISLGWALKKKLIISEIAVKMRERKHGSSSIMGFNTILYMAKVQTYILIDYLFGTER